MAGKRKANMSLSVLNNKSLRVYDTNSDLKVILVSILPGHGSSSIANKDVNSVDYRDWLANLGVFDISKRGKEQVIKDLYTICNEHMNNANYDSNLKKVLVIYCSYKWEDHKIYNLKTSIFVSSSKDSQSFRYDGTYDKKYLFSLHTDILPALRNDYISFSDCTYCVNHIIAGCYFYTTDIIDMDLSTTIIYNANLFSDFTTFCNNDLLNQYVSNKNYDFRSSKPELTYYTSRKIKLHLVSVIQRSSYDFDNLHEFRHAHELKKFSGNFYNDIVESINISCLTHCNDSVIIFFNGNWNDYNDKSICNNVVIDSENNIIHSDNKKVEPIKDFFVSNDKVLLSMIHNYVQLSGANFFEFKGHNPTPIESNTKVCCLD